MKSYRWVRVTALIFIGMFLAARILVPEHAELLQVQLDDPSFQDEFEGNQLNTDNWTALDYPNDEAPFCWKAGEVSVFDGSLAIKTELDLSCPNDGVSTGAVITSTFSFTYGRIDARLKLGSGSGLNFAFWLLGSNCQQTLVYTELNPPPCNWPTSGSNEIDIQEQYPYGDYRTTNQQIHWDKNDPGCRPSLGFDPREDYHVYSFFWQPGQAQWLIDGKVTCTVTKSVPNTPMFVIFQTAAKCPCKTLPSTTLVDYVRVFPLRGSSSP